jgi:hypothetical protein
MLLFIFIRADDDGDDNDGNFFLENLTIKQSMEFLMLQYFAKLLNRSFLLVSWPKPIINHNQLTPAIRLSGLFGSITLR